MSQHKIEKKLWGCRVEVYRDPKASIHILCIKPGMASSIHYHRSTYNQFVVTRGELIIKLSNYEYKVLAGTGPIVIMPKVLHQFEAVGKCRVIETAYIDQESGLLPDNDIVRVNNWEDESWVSY